MWSVTAIAPSPCSRAVASSTSTGVSQSPEWSVCMCRSTSISGRCGEPRRDLRVARAACGAGRRARRRSLRRAARAGLPGNERVAAGIGAPQRLAACGVGHGARVEAAEKVVLQAPADERGERALAGAVEGRDVQRAREAQRGVRQARRERVVDVDDVERHLAEQFLDGPRDVERERAAPAREAPRASSPTASARGSPLSVPSSSASPWPRSSRSARRVSRTSAAERDGASTSTRCPRRESSPATARTCCASGVSASHGSGLTWAIERRSLTRSAAVRPSSSWRRARLARPRLFSASPRAGRRSAR